MPNETATRLISSHSKPQPQDVTVPHFQSLLAAIRAAAPLLGPNFPPRTTAALALLHPEESALSPENLNAFLTTPTVWLRARYCFQNPPIFLTCILLQWASTLAFPIYLRDCIMPFSATDTALGDLPRLNDLSKRVFSVVMAPAPDTHALAAILDSIGPAGLSHIFGLRNTIGTLTGSLPLSRSDLERAAYLPIAASPSGKVLSVSGRALEKHLGRLGVGWGSCYWGEENAVGGNVKAKNARAAGHVVLIIDNSVWMNVAALPGGEVAFEIRVASGHGARWHYADGSFIGFIEPHEG